MDFNTYKLHHRYFNNKLEKNARANIFDSDTARMLDSYFNGQLILRQLTNLNFEMIVTSLLAAIYLCA